MNVKMNRWYIYKITFMNGCTYIGKHHQIKENDNYITSSSYYHNKGGKDILLRREIILDNLPDSDTCDIMETICILHDRAENINNVNYNKGAWVSNQFDRGFKGKENGMYGKKMTDVCSKEKLEEMAKKRSATYAAKWADYRATHNGMIPCQYKQWKEKQRNEKIREINKQIRIAHKEYNDKLKSLPKKWYYNTQTLKETYWHELPGPEWKLGRVPHELWDEAKKKSYAEKHAESFAGWFDRLPEDKQYELRQKTKENTTGRVWYTDGKNNIYARQGQDIPEGYYPGLTFEKTELYIKTRLGRRKNNG